MREGNQRTGLIDFCSTVKNLLNDNLIIVEIGSYCGSGTLIINEIFTNSKIYCVDGWEKYIESCSVYDIEKQGIELQEAENLFDQRTKNIPNIIKNKRFSLEFVNDVENNSVDLIYIDGNHDYEFVKNDLIAWLPKIKLGGVIGGHDWGWLTVQKAILEVFGKPPNKTFIDGSWFFVNES